MSLLILKFYHYLSGARSDFGLTVRRIGRDGSGKRACVFEMTSFCRPVLGNRKKMSKYLPKEGFSPPKLRKDNNFFNFVNPALQGPRRLESGLKGLFGGLIRLKREIMCRCSRFCRC